MANCFVCHFKEVAGICINSDCPRNKITKKVSKENSPDGGGSNEQVRSSS